MSKLNLRLAKILFALLGGILLVMIFLPTLLSTRLGKSVLEKELSRRLHAAVTIHSLSFSWLGPQSFEQIQIVNEDMVGSIEQIQSYVRLWALSHLFRAPLHFIDFGCIKAHRLDASLEKRLNQESLKATLRLKGGNFSFPRYGNMNIKQINAQISHHEVQASAATEQGGHFSMSGTMLSEEECAFTLELKNMPTLPFDYCFNGKGLLYAALGKTVDLSGAIKMRQQTGAIECHLTSPLASLSFNGELYHARPEILDFERAKTARIDDLKLVHISNIDQFTIVDSSEFSRSSKSKFQAAHGIDHARPEIWNFSLKQPLIASLHITPALSLAFTNRATWIKTIESKTDTTLRVEPEDSSLAIEPYSLDAIKVKQATLDMGQMLCKEGASFIPILKFLKKGLFIPSPFPIWFTPVSLAIEEGLLKIGRLDALIANSLHLCTWGEIDLMTNRLHLTLGIPADTLTDSLGITGLSQNYVLKIPLHGSIDHPQLDTKTATAKIAALLSVQQIGKKTKVLGTVFDLFKSLQEEKEAPLPHRPFPWEKTH